jgi:hypothetical protein
MTRYEDEEGILSLVWVRCTADIRNGKKSSFYVEPWCSRCVEI